MTSLTQQSKRSPAGGLAGGPQQQAALEPPKFCDVCQTAHAGLYCVADDAYLCSVCDIDVHNANSLALRHERVRLGANGAPVKIERKATGGESPRVCSLGKDDGCAVVPVVSASSGSSMGFTRRRSKKAKSPSGTYSGAARHTQGPESAAAARTVAATTAAPQTVPVGSYFEADYDEQHRKEMLEPKEEPETVGNNAGNGPFAWDSTDFSRIMDGDVGAMINEMPGLESVDPLHGEHYDEDQENPFSYEASPTFEDAGAVAAEGDTSSAIQQSSVTAGTDGLSKHGGWEGGETDTQLKPKSGREAKLNLFDGFDKMLPGCPSLRLNYEDVLSAWSTRGISPWLDDARPPQELEREGSEILDPWGSGENGVVPDITLPTPSDIVITVGEEGLVAENREARVLRYREKRRNRLLYKKVRYEIRKLNAERRPRVKGRFVKRAT